MSLGDRPIGPPVAAPWDHAAVITRPSPALTTPMGVLYAGDCVAVLSDIQAASVDTVFADPPFNLGKL